jgi:hypothetical protein
VEYLPIVACEIGLIACFAIFGIRGLWMRPIKPSPKVSAIGAVLLPTCTAFVSIRWFFGLGTIHDVAIPWIMLLNLLLTFALAIGHLTSTEVGGDLTDRYWPSLVGRAVVS